jgi:polyketide cyclase/dehydrase/lipid transport protein
VAFFRVLAHIDASASRVWSLLEDWEGSAAWMVDATTVEVLGQPRRGVGTRIRAVTDIAGVPLTDLMEVVGWEEERSITVMHRGWPIKGIAWFELRPAKDGGTWFEWAEELDPPLGPLGELGGRALKRPIERVLRKSVAKLKQLAESAS